MHDGNARECLRTKNVVGARLEIRSKRAYIKLHDQLMEQKANLAADIQNFKAAIAGQATEADPPAQRAIARSELARLGLDGGAAALVETIDEGEIEAELAELIEQEGDGEAAASAEAI